MIHTTQKELKSLLGRGLAISLNQFRERFPESGRGSVTQLGYCCNSSGCSGELLMHLETKQLVVLLGSEIYAL